MSSSRLLTSVLLSMLLVSSVAVAATSGSVTLGGTVTSSLQITSSATAGASTLDLSGGEQIAKVSDLTMSTNNEQGLTLSASSGNLTKAGGTSIAFQVTTTVDDDPEPVAADFAVASGTPYTVGNSAAGTLTKDLYILYTPATLQDPGNYSGSISLTVSDN